MRRFILLLAIGIVVALGPAYADEWSEKCVWVKEGSTLIVMHDGNAEQIRLHGICCPHWGQDFALEAAQFTQRMASDKIVRVEDPQPTKYGIFARVFIGDKCLNEELVRGGLAEWIQYYAWDDMKLEQAYLEARQKGIKIWSRPNRAPCFKVGGKNHKRAPEGSEQD
ncbi:MAG: thermonuclease family protein [Desulfomonilaceae bacterium]